MDGGFFGDLDSGQFPAECREFFMKIGEKNDAFENEVRTRKICEIAAEITKMFDD